MYTQDEIRILKETLLFRFAFARLVQGHLKALNQFRLASLLSRVWHSAISRHRIILVSTRFSTFASLVQLRLFNTTQRLLVCRKASAQSVVTSSSSSVSLICSLLVSGGVELFPSLYNFQDAYANLCGHTSRQHFALGNTSYLVCLPRNL